MYWAGNFSPAAGRSFVCVSVMRISPRPSKSPIPNASARDEFVLRAVNPEVRP